MVTKIFRQTHQAPSIPPTQFECITHSPKDALDNNEIDDTLSLDSDEFETLAEYYILSELNTNPSI